MLSLTTLAALAAVQSPALAEKGKPALTAHSEETGLPLTAEQQSVSFDHAALAWEILPDSETIKGDATLSLTVKRPIERIQFDLDRNLPVSAIMIGGAPLAAERWRNPEGQLVIDLPRTYAAGDKIAVRIVYGGTPHVAVRAPWDGGFVWAKTPGGDPWVATAVQGEGCDLFWPCFDNSLVEIPVVDLAITVPKGLSAPSNGRLMGVDTLADGRTRWRWQTHNPNNYAIALNIAPYGELKADYRSRFGNTVPLSFYYLTGNEEKAKGLFAEFAPTLDFFETMIGPYPFADEKLGVAETPHLGMEHQTINAYGNGYRKSAEGYDSLFQHELAHEWFGNQLTNADWDDMWLHEGLGTYMQPLYAEWRGGRIAYLAAMAAQRPQIANAHPIVAGRSRTEDEVYSPETGPGQDIYVKGSWVMHTLRGLIGDEAFFTTLRRVVYGTPDPKPGNFAPRFSSTDEFVKIAKEESGRDLGWFFDVYLRSAALPKLVATQSGARLNLAWQAPGGVAFAMPIDIAIGGDVVSVPMADGTGSIALPDAKAHYVLDPEGKILRQSDDVDAFQDWMKEVQAARADAAKSGS
ncbi:MAG: M1 family metallopeptidase [Sphingomonadales bacterium]|nr:M1 family metallopeptidase [Sphingomonadales bacterium]